MAPWKLSDVNVWNTILSAVAPSTQNSYQKIFFQFVQFFEVRGDDFTSLSVERVLSFLQLFVGKSSSRVKTAVAALKFFLRVYHREDLANHPLLTLFGKGAQNLAPLPREKAVIWDPAKVLNEIKTWPIPSSFLECAREAILLLLLATGWRVDDVWKLSVMFECTEEYARFFFSCQEKMSCEGFLHYFSGCCSIFFKCADLSGCCGRTVFEKIATDSKDAV
jgi:site-specific recombinase XerD